MDGGIIFDVAIVFMPIGLFLIAFAGHRLWQVSLGMALHTIAFIIVMLTLGGCTTRQDPGQWDAGLRYTLTHNCQANPDDPWKRC
jgi:multisubunit Na+/H+ antiporter MnhC subunit